MKVKKVGILTGGGDCPGLNAVIRGIVTRLNNAGVQCVGIMEGWKGLVENMTMTLDDKLVDPIIAEGGTILGSSRTNPYKGWDFVAADKKPAAVKKCVETYKKLGLDALIPLGGDDTLEIAYYLARDEGLNVVGCPKTIDNDVRETDYTYGFWSAVEITTEYMDRLKTTARSHRRAIVMECMGRHAGWIAAFAGLAGGADYIAVPEKEVHIDEICKACTDSRAKGKEYNLIVVGEGAVITGINDKATLAEKAKTVAAVEAVLKEKGIESPYGKASRDNFGNPKIKMGELAEAVANAIEKKTKIETRFVTPAHLQRGGTTCAYDRIIGTQFGVRAADAVLNGDFNTFVVMKGTAMKLIPMKGVLRENQTEPKLYKLLDLDFLELAKVFFG